MLVNPAQQLLLIDAGEQAEGEIGQITQEGRDIQDSYGIGIGQAEVVAAFPEDLQQDNLDDKAVELMLQAAAVKIVHKQRIDGIEAEQCSEKCHVYGAAACDELVGDFPRGIGEIVEKAEACDINQRKQQVG